MRERKIEAAAEARRQPEQVESSAEARRQSGRPEPPAEAGRQPEQVEPSAESRKQSGRPEPSADARRPVGKPVYVELAMRCTMEELWRHTQQPEQHERWDLRFSSIRYLPREEGEAQRFLYTTRIGFGLAIRGSGATRERTGPDGVRVSALQFQSPQRLSLIRSGAGFWRYEPGERPGELRFLTRYTYSTRFGASGRLLDRFVFRPLMGWATAWSFDRLRLWLEKGWAPELTLRLALVYAVSLALLSGLWLYEGLVPKLLLPSSEELRLLHGLGFSPEAARMSLAALGLGEAALGAALLLGRSARLLRWQGVLLAALAAGALISRPEQLAEPFSALTLTLPMLGLSAAALLAQPFVPRAGRCRRQPPSASEAARRRADADSPLRSRSGADGSHGAADIPLDFERSLFDDPSSR
ncbi:DoxX-like family protein [Paenibacillus pasadenensis]|uniref:DoxX-like family protein n=1 Tax=Paenibacillus TaxID=44249 RepID=UPI0004224CD5|nr:MULTISPECIES: DoxX-like family protein [Paenibacillus]